MEPIHIVYNELEIDGNNIFTANIFQENDVENVLFDKNKEYAITGMTIKPELVDSELVKVIHTKELQRINNSRKNKKLQRTKSKLNYISTQNKNTCNTFYKENRNCFFNTTSKKWGFFGIWLLQAL